MFTGIVEAIGTLVALNPRDGDAELIIDAGAMRLADQSVGDSVAVAGACLTITRLEGTRFAADVSRETLSRTTLGERQLGARVNLERALKAGAPLGGHYVTGHVDGVGQVHALAEEARSRRVVFELPPPLARYVAEKGSVTVEGVSLTVNEVDGNRFGVNLIPHTLHATTLSELARGSAVNVEVDIIARYVERLMSTSSAS